MNKFYTKLLDLSLTKICLISFSWSFIISIILNLFARIFIANDPFNGGFILPDAIGFHQDAMIYYQIMENWGFQKWTLRPDNCGTTCFDEMVAMVAFIYYWIYPSSIIILIANAAIHAASTYVIYKIFFKITKNKKITFLSVLVFIFFPSQFLWVSQIHRDGIFILGILIYFLIILDYFNFIYLKKINYFNFIFKLISLSFLSTLLLSISRDYYVEIFILINYLYCLICIFYILLFKKQFVSFKNIIYPVLLGLCIFVSSFSMNFKYLKGKSFVYLAYQFMFDNYEEFNVTYYHTDTSVVMDNDLKTYICDKFGDINNYKEVFLRSNLRSLCVRDLTYEQVLTLDEDNMPIKNDDNKKIDKNETNNQITIKNASEFDKHELELEKNFKLIRNTKWEPTNWIPKYIDSKIKRLAFLRLGFVTTEGNTNIDNDVTFSNSLDFIYYIPRALQISYLSPFPTYLMNYEGSKVKHIIFSTIFLETIIISISIILLLLNLKYYFSKPEFLSILFICSCNLIIFSSTINNVGTLIRMRYGFIALFIGIIISYYLKKNNPSFYDK